ncbi:putative bifunctional diguanylate cyclase/phosphodiesterase [Saccharibacillus alkalitolerans]|uniref:EAL domain-containing protein n=1 Tax=Saccharibacillus alkalitolerans TaxID=2705290 RepID=A0ABX0FC60_9BACL|nr:EAL domain-containing protein [Saccharibacillus alkalitolerans]NGZ78005.1 EAL domain-containing protein [Saccharibacillus alkalitolerans]
MTHYSKAILINEYFAAAGLLCSVIACLMIPLLTSGGVRSLRELLSPARIPRLALMGLCFGGTVLFGTLAVLPGEFVAYEFLYLLFPSAAGLLLCMLALRLTGDSGGWKGALHFTSSAAVLTVLIILFNYSNVYLLFGRVDLRAEVILTAAIGLFSALFSLVRLALLVTRRTGRIFERFPPAGLLFSAAATTIIPAVMTLSAMPADIDSLVPGISDRLAPYILLFTVAVGLMILTDRYREEDAEKKYRELHEKEMHYMSLFDYNPDAVFALDDGGRIFDMNGRARDMVSRIPEGAGLHMITEWTSTDQQDKILQHYEKVLGGASDEIEVTLQIGSREPVNLILTSLPILIEGRFTGAYSIAKNITESKKNQEKIRHLAYYDELTDLTNRKYMREYVDNLASGKKDLPFYLFFVDFDRFKKINDLFGHEFGDRVIRHSALKLQNALPAGTVLSRSTADEFIAVLDSGLDPLQAAQAIVREFSLPFQVGQQMIGLTASIGIARFPEDGIDGETLFNHADLARFDAKSRGGGRFSLFDHSRAQENQERLILERDLQAAIEQDQLVLFYQPKVDTRTGELVGVEALVRWKHPALGMVPPLKFIPVAEESGLIVPLERWVLRTACRQIQAWAREGRPQIPVAVNISQIHLMQTDIVESVLSTLEERMIDHRLLELEVTESAMMHNEEQVIAILSRFKQAGIAISLDDFGTGYSSLSYMHLLPIDCLKIDRSFIKDITTNENSRAIVEMILTMARQLELRIVAEGIEYEEQVALLRDLRCFVAQGFYYGKPVPAEEIHVCSDLSS